MLLDRVLVPFIDFRATEMLLGRVRCRVPEVGLWEKGRVRLCLQVREGR